MDLAEMLFYLLVVAGIVALTCIALFLLEWRDEHRRISRLDPNPPDIESIP